MTWDGVNRRARSQECSEINHLSEEIARLDERIMASDKAIVVALAALKDSNETFVTRRELWGLMFALLTLGVSIAAIFFGRG